AGIVHARGAFVAIVDVDEAAAEAAAGALGARALAITADVRDRAAMAALTQRVVDTFGHLDVVGGGRAGAPPPPPPPPRGWPPRIGRVV
ncbi:SDR family oxidoreductase, partial [Nocardia sp. NPDC058497]|uniref:SDR family oxidoreductase n=1 Tax=Nocardia sp. NPDC058497 TaxID=3346529 RepID=UPI0036668F16